MGKHKKKGHSGEEKVREKMSSPKSEIQLIKSNCNKRKPESQGKRGETNG
jgi:hypothetical protein